MSRCAENAATVAVLMAAFEDARFLPAQLESIRGQDHTDFELWISRDCDREEIGRVLDEYAPAFGTARFFVVSGPRKGCSANFLSLARNPDIEADYFAWSDQDDVWERDKLSRAVAALARAPRSTPALYGSRSRLIDARGADLGLSRDRGPAPGRPHAFRHALAENFMSGHTMVMNRAARELLRASGVTDAPFHDWWTCLIVAGAGGRVIYDPRPTVRYRLHDRNATAVGKSRLARLSRRLSRTVGGETRRVGKENLRALRKASRLLTPENRRTLEAYGAALEKSLPGRLWGIGKAGVRRRTRSETLLMFAEAAFNRL